MIENSVVFIVILLLVVNILIKYRESKRTGEKVCMLLGGPFCFIAIVLLLLDLILI